MWCPQRRGLPHKRGRGSGGTRLPYSVLAGLALLVLGALFMTSRGHSSSGRASTPAALAAGAAAGPAVAAAGSPSSGSRRCTIGVDDQSDPAAAKLRRLRRQLRQTCGLGSGDGRQGGTQPVRVVVIGERNSGTNYLERLITANLDVALASVDGPEGRPVAPFWKHSLLSALSREQLRDWQHKGAGAHPPPPVVVVLVTKSPFSWLLSMERAPWHLGENIEAFTKKTPPGPRASRTSGASHKQGPPANSALRSFLHWCPKGLLLSSGLLAMRGLRHPP